MSDMPGEIITELRAGWDDQQGDISQGVASSTLTYQAYRDTPFLMYFFRHDQNDVLNMRYQFSHGWNPQTDVLAHLHLIPMADPVSPEVAYFTGVYAWAGFDLEVPALSSWTAFTASLTINPGDAFKEKFLPLFQATPAANATESDILLIQVQRAGTDPTDTYTTSKTGGTAAANLGILSADVHYSRNKVGTEAPIPTR